MKIAEYNRVRPIQRILRFKNEKLFPNLNHALKIVDGI